MKASRTVAVVLTGAALALLLTSCRQPPPSWIPRASDAGATRVESAKSLLLNPNLCIDEIAYEVGFQSLTHFNRVFRRIAGQSPTANCEQLAHE